MSYLYELDCHCHFSASADPGANGGVDALMSLDPANVSTTMEASSAIASYANRDRHIDMALEVTSDIVIHDVFLRAILEVSTSIDDGMTVDYSVNQDLNAVGEISQIS